MHRKLYVSRHTIACLVTDKKTFMNISTFYYEYKEYKCTLFRNKCVTISHLFNRFNIYNNYNVPLNISKHINIHCNS